MYLQSGALELEWHVPRSIIPSELQNSQKVIEQYLANPIDLQGKKAKDHLTTKRRTRRRAESSSEEDHAGLSDTGEDDFLPNDEASKERRAARKAAREERRAAKRLAREERSSNKRERKKKEVQIYKSAELIQDSDAELGDDDAFFAKERELMEKANKAGQGAYVSATMLERGTKKRKQREGGKKRMGKRSKAAADVDGDEEAGKAEAADDSSPEDSPTNAKPRARPRPKPKQSLKTPESNADDGGISSGDEDREPVGWEKPRARPRPRPRIAAESDEDEEESNKPSGKNDESVDDA